MTVSVAGSVWDDVVGQEAVVAELAHAASNPAALTHAWLLTGPSGSGRSVAARAFAAALECEHGTGCGTCSQCVTVRAGTHPDVTLVATDLVQLKVADVRHLVVTAAQSPASGRYRVIIIEDADRMRDDSWNSLLKAVEEPPPHTIWLLCAPSPTDILPTIRSRCRMVNLRIPSAEAVANLVVQRDGVDPQVALAAARAAQSHVGLARRLAGDPDARERRSQVIALTNSMRSVPAAVLAAERLIKLADAEAKAATEHYEATELADLRRALGVPAGEAVPVKLRGQLKALEDDQKRRATRRKRDVLDLAMLDLLSCYRDVLVLQLRADVALINGLGADDLAVVQAVARDSTPEQTLRRMDAIQLARKRLAGNVAPLLVMEALAIALVP